MKKVQTEPQFPKWLKIENTSNHEHRQPIYMLIKTESDLLQAKIRYSSPMYNLTEFEKDPRRQILTQRKSFR